ncbi:MAG: LamG-like jellyroll fold domain-containing protein [Caldilineaceae bacterium]
MNSLMQHRRQVVVLFTLVGILALGWIGLPRVKAQGFSFSAPTDPVTAAWEKARAAGSYSFTSDVTQITVPVAKVSNVGRSSRTEQLHLSGQTDLRAQRLEMQLWSAGGSVLQAESGVAIKVEQGRTWMRRGAGDWQAAEGYADGLAPQGDFLTYLHAMRAVQAHAAEQRAGIELTRYSFTIDGPTFAAYMRDQMEAALRAKGELPTGVSLDPPSYYQQMTGDGELWVGANGLPLRQILNLNFPEQREQTTHAQIVVDFSHFGTPQVTPLAYLQNGDLMGLAATLLSSLPALTPLGLLLPLLVAVVLLLRYRRSRTVYIGLVTAILFSLVIGPLLTTLKLETFLAAQQAKAASQDEEQALADAAREASADWGRPQWNPQVNPVEVGRLGDIREPQSNDWEIAAQSPNLSISQSPTLQLSDPGTDSDSDGLSDFAEARVGTDPTLADSDEDGISDGLEVKGFPLGGQNWYVDALALDSNNDGIADGQEWSNDGNSQPDDTDGDNIPDLFDPDNDNDGVPDRQDLAPFSQGGTTFAESTPLKLTLNNLTAGSPTLVDFQVRPNVPEHLWYAFNVLDWPRNDNQGQVQDVDGKSFADLAAAQGRTAGTNEAFGDMKLVPMLEIRLPASGANLPPQSELTPYNISVNRLSADGSQQVVYIPLSIVSDEQSGQRVAFSARMRYLPSGSWPTPHEVRLAWVVQMLTDIPCDPSNAQDRAAGCADDRYIHNVPQVVQSYYDAFTLSGLSVSEEHGTKSALIYEDPTVDPDRKDDVALTALSLGLDHSFLAARDADHNSQRDVDIDELARRVDRTVNQNVASDQRWGLDGALNVLRVERHDYATLDQAAIFTAMTDTVRLLNSNFNAVWASDNTIKPTVAYVYEQQARGLGLDASKTGEGYVTLASNLVTVDMQPSGRARAGLATLAGVKWGHYCRANSSATWDLCASDLMWEELQARYGAQPLPEDNFDPDVSAGSNVVMQLHNLALSQGINAVVQVDNQLVSGQYTLKSDSELASNVRSSVSAGGAAVKAISNIVVMDRYISKGVIKAQMGQNVVNFLEKGTSRKIVNAFRKDPLKSTRTAVGVALLINALLIGSYQLNDAAGGGAREGKIALRVLAVTLQTYFSLVDPLLTVARWGREVGKVSELLSSSSTKLGASRTAGAIGAVISVAIVWGFFIASMVSNKVSAFSPEFNKALAETVAATIYIIVLAILSATVVGLIIVGVVAVIDAILTAVCELGVDQLRSDTFYGGACITLGTTATKVIAYFLYNYDLMIDTGRDDLVQPGAPSSRLADPIKGFVAGNDLTVSLPITTHIVHKSPDPANGLYINAYLYFFSPDNLRSTTFNYSLTRSAPQDLAASRGQMSGAWQNVGVDRKYILTPMYGGTAQTTLSINGLSMLPGINRAADFYLNMGYALPAYECWGVPLPPLFYPVPFCSVRTFTGKNSSKLDSLRYDIFPNSIDGLMAMGNKGNAGRGLSWDPQFPALRDSDGDGLIAQARGGLDPNDATWDSDGDGLSDSYELERRSAGRAFSPSQCDSDSDGLTDRQEAEFGSNPALPDSDNDGLGDADEVWHRVYTISNCQPSSQWSGGWDVTINAATPFTIHVSSDPSLADTDGDGVGDLAERQLAQHADPAQRLDDQNVPYNPNLANTPPLAIYTASDKRYVAPGQSLIYTTTVVARTALAPSVLNVTVPAQLGLSPAPYVLPFNPLTFSGAQTVTQQTNLSAQAGPNTQPLTLTLSSQVRARLAPIATATLAWEPVTFQSLGSPAQTARRMASTWSVPDRQDSYLIATLTSSNSGRSGVGSALANTLPGGQANTLFTTSSDTFGGSFMGDDPVDVACNRSGICLAVWDYHLTSIFGPSDRVLGAVMNAAGQLQRTFLPNDIAPNSFYAQVASDGTNFLVVYEYTPLATLQTFLRWVRYDQNGNELNRGEQLIDNARTTPQTVPSIALDLAWLGDRYGLVWKPIRPRSSTLLPFYTGTLDANGAAIGSLANYNGAGGLEPEWDESGAPTLAYDPVNKRTLLLYRTYFSNSPVAAYLYQGAMTSLIKADLLFRLINSGSFVTVQPPRAVYNPLVNGWMVTTYQVTRLYNADLTGDLIPPVVTNLPDLPLACPAPNAVPVAELRFEELPGSSSFVDSSVRGGNNAFCPTGSCPAGGYPGATVAQRAIGAPSSDTSVQFDGIDNVLDIPNPLGSEFSVAFWYKASATSDATQFIVQSGFNPFAGQPDGFSVRISNKVNSVQFIAGGVSASNASPTPLYDGQWHWLVATRRLNGDLALYVDGGPTPLATASGSATPAMFNTVRLRGGGTALQLDNLQLYQSALTPSTIQAIYEQRAQAYCIGVTNYQWSKVNASIPDTRGGPITASASLTVVVDSDKPTSTISGLTNNQVIQGNQVQTIGGNADDPTSGVASVEVQINNGGWQTATGVATWAYNLTLGEGLYTIQTRATDQVGNVETPGASITLRADATPPQVTLTSPPLPFATVTRNSANQWVTPLSGTASDSGSGLAPNGVEVRLQGQGDAVGNNWQPATLNGNNWTLNYAFAPALLDPTGIYTVSVRAVDAVGNQTADDAASAILRLDVTGPTATLNEQDATRLLITATLTLGGLVTDTGTAGVDKLEIAFIPVEQIAALANDITAEQADAQLNRTWLPASLAQRGANATAWSLPLPADMENEYQIDLRATDSQGNLRRSDNVWRGVIDMLPPRLTAAAGRASIAFLYQNFISCSASDRYLDEASFDCPANAFYPPTRNFDSNGALQSLFPDRTIVNGLLNGVYYWSPINVPPATVRACDNYGHCATLTSTNAVATADAASAEVTVNAAAVGEPQAVIVAPTQESFVAANGALNVTVAAEASALLKTVTISLDNQVVQSLALPQSEAITRTLRTLSLTGISEGQHTLTARATDWAGATQSSDFPVTFTLDAQSPTVTIDPAPLTNADTWQAGSDILRFNGTATDSIGLAAVQIREGNGEFVDAAFANGLWQTALPVTDPEGRTLTITVRAIDRAGRISQVTQAIGTNLGTAAPPETTLLSGPANPSAANSASFVFTGTLSTVAFECQLDGGAFVPCAIPQSYSELSKGSHTFRVRAIDSAGNVDLSPAEFTWTINASALDATLTASPANPSNSRNATFAFTGSGNAFDCALDAGAFAACSSPIAYSSLSYGEHSFQVRARNGSNVGAATRFVWVITNTAPVANSQTVTTTENISLTLTLVASDPDPLGYQVGTPAHGLLLGAPPNLTYNPDSKFFGTDSFTFVANDGLLSSNVATVTIVVKAGDKIAPETTLVSTPANPSTNPDASFVFSGTDNLALASFVCRLDSATFAPCTSPKTYTSLADGSHTFQVQAVDSAGNVDATPASYTWVVQRGTVIAVCGGFTVIQKTGGSYVAPGWSGTIKVGTASNNTLNGTAGADLILGLAGNDAIDGQGGNDLLCAGDGNDLIQGFAGNDLLDGGKGNDVLNGGTGDYDLLLGGDGNDTLLDGDGVSNASAGSGNDLLTLALRNGWRNASGQARFAGLAAGYGNDAVGLAILGSTRFLLDITGDERDTPASPLEGKGDTLALVGLIDPTSTIIKFEQRLGVTGASTDDIAVIDMAIPGEEAGAEYLTEPVGDGSEEIETSNRIFLPLINR